MKVLSALGIGALALAACTSPAPAPAESPAAVATHAESGLPVVPLTISADGKAHAFRVELTVTPDDRRQGLMFRTELGPDEGMLFTYPEPMSRRGTCFHMKNTVIPLDIVFFDDAGKIVDIHADRQPYSLECRPSKVESWGALEIAGGRAAQLGIQEGDVLRWERPGAAAP